MPSQARDVKFYELQNREYLNILKFLQNQDDDNLEIFLENLIQKTCTEPDLYKEFNRLDKYCIILSVIMICIGNTLEYTLTCSETEKQFNVEIVLSDIISKINNINFSDITISLTGDDYMKVSGPTSLRGVSDNIIQTLHINNKTFDMTQYSTDQLDVIVRDLPYNVFAHLRDTFQNIHNDCQDIIYFSYRSPHVDDAKPTEYKFNIYDSSFFEFIKTLLKEDLLGYYKIFYALTTKFKFDMTYIQSITPSETKMYLSFVKEDIKLRQEQKQKQATAGKSTMGDITAPIQPPA